MANASTKRIALLGFELESNRFAPVVGKTEFTGKLVLKGADMMADLATENPRSPGTLVGFTRTMDKTGSWTPVPIMVAGAGAAGAVAPLLPRPHRLGPGGGDGDEGDSALGRVQIGRRAGFRQIAARTGVGHAILIQVADIGEDAVLAEIVGMVVGTSHHLDAQPLQLLDNLGIGAHVGSPRSGGRGVFIVVKQHLGVGSGDIGAVEQLYQA